MDLSDSEIRVLGCLLEKQRTTPDHYPLSLNSLRLACNQATNRDPVVDYDENTIRDALHRLGRRGFIRLAGASRAAKYRHLLAEALPMTSAEQAVMCVLMLRGAQTPGELKQRGERIHAFAGLEEVHSTLSGLIERDLVARLDRRPGQKEERYAQLLGQDAEPQPEAAVAAQASDPPTRPVASTPDRELSERVERLERELAELREAIQELRGAAAGPDRTREAAGEDVAGEDVAGEGVAGEADSGPAPDAWGVHLGQTSP